MLWLIVEFVDVQDESLMCLLCTVNVRKDRLRYDRSISYPVIERSTNSIIELTCSVPNVQLYLYTKESRTDIEIILYLCMYRNCIAPM